MHFHIIIPVLNGAKYLDEALQSVRAQTWQDWTAIIRDGGSLDGSVEIAKRHALEDQRIFVRSEPDNGQYDAVCQGLNAAPEGMLAWLNSDDLYMPWAFETVANVYKTKHAKWVTGLPSLWDDRGRLSATLPSGFNARSLIRMGWRHDALLGCLQQESIFFHSSLWRALDKSYKETFARSTLAGDFFLWTCLAQQENLYTTPAAIAGFRVHQGNRSRINAHGYQREAYELGARRFPKFLRPLIRDIHDIISTLCHLRAFRRAAWALHRPRNETK